jgi:hypothetical protein
MEKTTYEKVSEVEFKSIEPQPAKETIYNLDGLNAQRQGYLDQIDSCNKAIADIDDLIAKGQDLEVMTQLEAQAMVAEDLEEVK